jgi:hypothetical protein
MIEKDDWKIAIEDARARQTALVGLIYFTDTQAMGLLRLCVTIGTATASGAIAGLTATAAAASIIPRPAGWALASATLALLVSAWYCFKAMSTAKISLPGRGAEWWLFVATSKIDRTEALTNYLKNLAEKHSVNRGVNENTAGALSKAKLWSIASLPIALLIGVIAIRYRF